MNRQQNAPVVGAITWKCCIRAQGFVNDQHATKWIWGEDAGQELLYIIGRVGQHEDLINKEDGGAKYFVEIYAQFKDWRNMRQSLILFPKARWLTKMERGDPQTQRDNLANGCWEEFGELEE